MVLHLFGITKKLEEKIKKAGIHTKTELKNSPLYDELPVATKLHLKYKIENLSYDIASDIIHLFNIIGSHFIPVGSYARKVQKAKDLDLLTTLSIPQTIELIQKLEEPKYVDKYASGKNKTTVIISYNTDKNRYYKIDIFHTTDEDLPYALFHYIGNKNFNIRSRRLAKLLGYKLSQYGLFKNNKKIIVNSEKELFNILNITYKTPEQRNE